MVGAMLPKEILSFSLFQSLNCTVNSTIFKSSSQQNNGQMDSPSRHREKEKEREKNTDTEIDLLNFDRDKMMVISHENKAYI